MLEPDSVVILCILSNVAIAVTNQSSEDKILGLLVDLWYIYKTAAFLLPKDVQGLLSIGVGQRLYLKIDWFDMQIIVLLDLFDQLLFSNSLVFKEKVLQENKTC